MKSLLFGLISICGVVFYAIGGQIDQYIEIHSIVMVVGGTVALLFFTTPGAVYSILKRSMFMLMGPEESFNSYREELEQLAKVRRGGRESSSSLIRYASELWDQGIDSNLFITLISQKRMELENETIDAVQTLKNLAKYPPALGMTGTVMGMISLFSSLDGNESQIGSSLAIAMTATFFGLLLTNMFLSPLADRLQVRHVNRKRLIGNTYQILLLINQGEPLQLVSGELEERIGA